MVALTAVACLLGPAVGASDGEVRVLTLESAVFLALEENLELRIEQDNPGIAAETVEQAQAAFTPRFDISTDWFDGERFTNSILETAPELADGKILETGWRSETSVVGEVRFGLDYAFSLTTNDLETNNPIRLYDQSYTPRATLSLTQPLLRDAGVAVNTVRIRQAEALESQARLDVESEMLRVILQVESSYWLARFAREHAEVVRGNLQLAERLAERLERMTAAGLATELDLSQARLAVEARRSELARAEADRWNAQTALRLVVDPSLPHTTMIDTVDELAPDAPPPANLDARLQRALATRPEIERQRLAVESVELEERRARDERRWRLDARGSLTYGGLAGEGLGPRVFVPPAPDLLARTDFWDAFEDGATSWAVGLQLEIPLGKRAALAGVDGAVLRLRQERTRLELAKARVRAETEIAFRDMSAESLRLRSAERGVELAQEQLAAEERNLAAGLATALQVLQAQDQLAVARDAELQARVDYAVAAARLDAAEAGSLERYNLRIEP